MSPINPRRRFLAALCALGFGTLPRPSLAKASGVGRVAVIQGEAWLHDLAGEHRLYPGDPVGEGERLSTGTSSRLQVLFVDGTLLTIGPDSTVEVAHYEAADGERVALLRLLAGILRVAIGDDAAWDSFEVESGTAVASVRATEWVVEETATGSAVFVLSGRVAVAGKAPVAPAVVVLAPGEGTDVPEGGAPTPPKEWGPGRRDATLERVSLL